MSDDIVARSDALDEKLAGTDIQQTVTGLVAYGRRNRRLIRLLIASVIFDVLLSAGLGFTTWRADTAAHRADTAAGEAATLARQVARTTQNVRDACLAGNEFRADQVKLWNFVLALSGSDPGDTPEEVERQRVQTAQFKEFLKGTFSPRVCPGAP